MLLVQERPIKILKRDRAEEVGLEMRPVVEGQRPKAVVRVVSEDVASRLGRDVGMAFDVARSTNDG